MKKILSALIFFSLMCIDLQAQEPYKNVLDIPMVLVEGGTFEMGGMEVYGEQCYPDEFPRHTVSLNDYYIAQYEVTQELYEFVMGYNPSHFEGDSLPVDNISWVDAKTFIFELNKMTGKNYRLPTEAEWEFAARGGRWSEGYNYSGGDDIKELGWCDGNSRRRTHQVGTKKPNELGIYDMSGNVYEWCQDRYALYKGGEQINPQGPDYGKARVMRGGSWRSEPRNCRNTYRSSEDYESRILNVGIRLAMDY